MGIAELEGGDEERGRAVSGSICRVQGPPADVQHLLQLFPPYTSIPPSEPSPYLYLAQSAEDPHEALGYYSAAAVLIEKRLANPQTREDDEDEGKPMAVTALVAMIEIWMSDLWCAFWRETCRLIAAWNQRRSRIAMRSSRGH